MKKLIIIPILLVCLTGASNRGVETRKNHLIIQDKLKYEPSIKVHQLDSLMKRL